MSAMTTSKVQFSFYSVLLLCFIWSCGSTQDPVAGGEDFPNAFAGLGDTLVQHMASLDNWDALSNTDKTKLSAIKDAIKKEDIAITAKTPAPSQYPSLAKESAIQSDFSIDLSDTALGYFRVISTQVFALYTQSDTLTARWDEYARDTIDDNESLISIQGCVTYSNETKRCYFYEDMDGDGLLISNEPNQCNPLIPTLCNIARSTEILYANTGAQSGAIFIAASGPDADFDLEQDNLIHYAKQFTLNKDGDTITLAEYTPLQDNMWWNESMDTLVYLQSRELRVTAVNTYSQQISEQIIGQAINPVDSTQNSFFSFYKKVSGPDGFSNVTSIEFLNNPHHSGDSIKLMQSGDTVVYDNVVFTKNKAKEIRTKITVLLGKDLDEKNNLFLHSEQEVLNHNTSHYRLFRFIPQTPYKDKEQPSDGSIYLEIRDANGYELYVEGRYSPTEFEVQAKDQDGNVWDFTFDASTGEEL
jgi:hypothetical protein